MIQAKFNEEDYKRIIGKLQKVTPNQRSRVMFNAMKMVGLQVRNRLITNVSGRILKRRTGRLAQSIESKVTPKLDGIGVVVGSGVRQGNRIPYADIHETGGTIRPKNAKYLTIPAKANKTSAGQTRFTAKELFSAYAGKLYFSNGALILKKSARAKGKVMFWLKKQVKIPARRYLSRTLEETQRKIVKILLTGVRQGLR